MGRLGQVARLGALVSLMGCGGGEPAPGSGVEMGGTGGASGAAGSLALGNNKAGMGGVGGSGGVATGGPPTITLHACGMPEQACATKVHTGDVVVHSIAEAMALAGVTSIAGSLTLDVAGESTDAAHVADAFNCLESVSGDLSIDLEPLGGDSSLWGLRNLTTVGGNVVNASSLTRTFADCGLARLQRVGAGLSGGSSGGIQIKGFGGTLDLSDLTSLDRLEVANTALTFIELPSSGTFQMTKLDIESNAYLTDIGGFAGVTVQTSPQPAGDVVRITNNFSLSDCRAQKIAQLFVSGGAEPADIVISGNLPCQMP